MPAFVPTAPLSRDPGSFRDPAGGVYHHDGRVFRYLTDRGAADFQSLEASGLLHTLIDQRVLVETTEVSVEQLPVDATSEPPALILEHERVPFISYSYEWPFELLRSAALQYLDVLRLSLDHGFVLKDATSFNTQFFGSRPVMIDVSSFEPYEAGRPWAGYAQFCRMFLNPLLLQSLVGLPYQSWLRASIEGIAPGELGALLPFRRKLRRDVLMHVVAQAWMGRRLAPDAEAVSQAAAQSISLKTLTKLIDQLERTISKLKRPGGADSNWSSYEQDCHYQTVDTAVKSRAVESVLKQVRPGTVWDLGCNNGQYSALAARSGSYVVAIDGDEQSVGGVTVRDDADSGRILPLVMDLANPSPDQGWGQRERQGLASRGPADLVLALAVVHHLCLTGGVPLAGVADWLAANAQAGIVEFVPLEDPMVRRLLATRLDRPEGYSEAAFRSALERHFRITHVERLPNSQRALYAVSRR